MKCTAVIVIVILTTVDGLLEKNVTTTKSPPQNETALIKDRSNRDSRRYIANYDKGLNDFYGDYNGYKPRPNRVKGRRRQKPKTTTPLYDYDDFEGYTMTEPKKDFSSGFEQYFKHPYVGNVGKIFNQDDINDFYLKGNNDYSKLVKDVTMELPFKSSQKLHVGNTDAYKESSNYKTLNYDKKDSSKLPTPISTTSWGNVKNLDIKNSYRDSWSTDSKKPSFSSYFSQQFDNKNKDYDFTKTYNQNKENDFGKTYNQQNKEYDFGKTYMQQFDTKDKEYDFGKTYYQQSTQSPLKSFDSQYPVKSYASNYNFDTKPFAEIQPTKYTIPPYTFGKLALKDTEYVSEFDMKGNPINPYASASSSDLFSEVSKDMYNLNKYNTPDFTKSFYDFNKQPETSTKSFFNFKNLADNGYGSSNYDNNWGYASSYNYGATDFSPAYGSQNYGAGDYNSKDIGSSQLFQKDNRFTSANAMTPGSQMSHHPIIIPVPQPYPVKVPVAKPVAVPILKEIKVPIEKLVPYPVYKNVPYPVEKRIPVPVEKQVPVPVPKPYPVKIPVIKNIYHHARDEEYDHNHSHDHPHHHHNHNYDEEYEPKRPRHRGRGEEHKRPPQRRGRGRSNPGHRN